MNSRQEEALCVGSALIERRMAQSTRSDKSGASWQGAVISLLIFFIQASSGPHALKGKSPVTIMYMVAAIE